MNEWIRIIDALEDRAPGYLTLAAIEAALGHSAQPAIDSGVLLVDYRQRLDETSSAPEPVVLARLNRRHPLVRQLTSW